jgi:uncharacterized protein (DUF924 family)
MTADSSADGIETVSPSDVLAFWTAAGPDKWFEKDEAFDAEVARRFFATWQAGADGKLAQWEATPAGALALTILLDQFPRNMFRGHARVYASDPAARAVGDRALARGFDRAVPQHLRRFFYLPFMHSENLADQERCIALARGLGNDDTLEDDTLEYAERHAEIIRRFGRFPHRNAVLGRISTPQEQAFLDEGGFAG